MTHERQKLRRRGSAGCYFILATVYLRLMRYPQGIPYALEAAKDDPLDVRYRWMLRVLTILANKPLETIPLQYRLAVQPSAPSPVHFVDVTKAAGVGNFALGRGAAWGDFNNDGFEDIFLTSNGWGDYDGDGRPDLFAVSFDAGCKLYHNLGHGRFEDLTQQAGIHCPIASYTCDFLDYNQDGRPDIFVSTYPKADMGSMIVHYLSGAPAPPNDRQLLFRNNGDGTFTRLSEEAGIVGLHGAMASQVSDIDNTGFPDIVLGTGNPALDWAEPKALYHNDGNGHFVDIAHARVSPIFWLGGASRSLKGSRGFE